MEEKLIKKVHVDTLERLVRNGHKVMVVPKKDGIELVIIKREKVNL